MKKPSLQPRLTLSLLAILALLWFIGGCAGSNQPTTKLRWPPPPEPPRIEYVRSIYGSSDLPRGTFAQIKDFFFGKSPDMALGKPYGITFADEATIYVVDTAKKGVMILNLETGKIRFIESLGPYGRLVEPVNLVLDSEHNLYVADTGLHKVVVFDSEGNFTRFIGQGVLQTPVGLALDKSEEKLYVSDASQHTVKIFSPAGELLGGFGERGDEKGQFYHPLGLTINRNDEVLVVDSFHFAVQAFDLAGNYLFSFGSTVEGLGSLARPRGITTDAENQIYITDALKNNIQIFDPSGQKILSLGGRGFGPGQFRLPAGLCFTADDRMFVVDSINKRIQEFKYVAPRGPGS